MEVEKKTNLQKPPIQASGPFWWYDIVMKEWVELRPGEQPPRLEESSRKRKS